MSLQDIRLQDRALTFLKRSLEKDRLPHSLLFSGPESVGKGLSAMTLAKAVNCERRGPTDSCDDCMSCRKIEGLNHPDVIRIGPEGAGNAVKIEKIRMIQKSIALKPFEARRKFFIIEKAELLTEEAANCILKTLEEPPGDSVIILITSHLNRVFSTLRSRCQWVLFSSASPEALKEFLIKGHNMAEREAHFLAHLSEGRIGRAVNMKDGGILKWKNEVLDRFNEKNIIFEEDPFFYDRKRAEVLEIMDILISWYRDILVLKDNKDTSLLINADRAEDLKLKTGHFSQREAEDMLDEALRMRMYIEHNINIKLALSNLATRTD